MTTTSERPWAKGLAKLRGLVLCRRAAVGTDLHGPIRDERLSELDAAYRVLAAAQAMFEAAYPMTERLSRFEQERRDVRGLELFSWQEIPVSVGHLRALRAALSQALGREESRDDQA